MHRMLTAAATLSLALGSAAAAQTSITIGMQLEPPHLDPTSAAAAAIDEVVYANVYEGLTRFGPDGSIHPGLAESWEIADDGLSYTFTLRPGVLFHDGATFTADDVAFTFERILADESTNAQKALYSAIDSVNVIDDRTVEITLERPNGALLFNLAWGDAVIIDPSDVETLQTKPVGTGPFMFSDWVQGDRVELVRNPDYWGEPAPLERATFKFISDPTAAFAAMMAGDIDAFPVYPAPENLAQFESDPRFRVLVGSTEGETILSMNNGVEPFNDIRVRQAVAHAIDRQAVIDGAMFGYGTPIGTHFAPHHPAYVDLTGLSAHDPERAKELLAEAGYPDGFTTTLKLPPPSYARRGGEIIAAQLRAVGIEAEIVNLEWAQWLEEVFRGKDFGLTIVSHTEPLDIGIYARPDYYFQYDDPVMQALNTGLEFMANPEDRNVVLGAMQDRIARQYVVGFLFQLAKTGVANARIEGLWENSPTQANDLTQVRWAE
ncbi:ABC transporter substrate-binding protein [Halovulum dunhuangense]|uniref:ABC transporter substrate-binding protein n=1 Tax=Halovulum dunhuangense TaxID=1505036 RepID=A0A849L018_9RHOB|nr:ABC transporter substrate-binding protein [Halovulum dunhuangense]NNU78860.1 ABC transporter substrate-binding protein [Halovulum dunhuangense]